MDSLIADLRVGARSLLRTPLATFVAGFSLALGIAVVTTLFTTVDGFVLRPLDAPEPDELVAVYTTNQERGWTSGSLSVPEILHFRENAGRLGVAGYRDRDVNLSGDQEPEHLPGLEATANIFQVLGVDPELGRGFLPEEEMVGGSRVVVLSHALWEERFGSDPEILGSTIRLEGRPFTVVGVMPERAPLPFSLASVWFPAELSGEEDRFGRAWSAVGRLSDGSLLDEASQEMDRLAVELERGYPDSNTGMGVRLVSFRQDLFGDDPRIGSLILLAAGIMVLLIACINVVSLLLARALRREREMAVRAALGATRTRLVRQLLTESVLLGAAGGLLGVVLAVAGVRGLLAMLPPIFSDIIFISGRVLAFNTLIAIAAGVFVGVAPSFQASRRELRSSLSDSGTRGSNAGVGRGRLRRGLVMAQLSLALVLLVSSGLLVRGLMAARAIEPGFRSEQLLTFNVRLPETGYPDDQSTRAFQTDLLARIEALPGVEAAAASTHLPMSGGLPQTYYAVEGENYSEGGEPTSPYQWVSDGYFQALEIPLGRGRFIAQEDAAGTTPVMVVNEAFVARHWSDGDPLGRRVEVAGEAREIVGVVGDVRSTSPLAPPRPAIYLPLSQGPRRTLSFALRTSDTPTSVTPAVRAAVREMDPDQPIFDVLTMEEMIANALVGEIIMPRIAGGLAVLALILALVGVYGTMAHAVASRRQETGIRMALGATQGTILRMVVGQGARMLAIGSGVGLVLAALAARGLSSQLFGVPSFDLAIFGLTTFILLGVGLVAAYLPARRATGVDPVRCMRAE